MRKPAVAVTVAAVMLALVTAVMAQELMKVRGWVSKIDTAATTITILPEGGKPVTIIMGDPESLSKVDEGDEAEARYRVQDGKNIGRRLQKLGGGCS